MLARWGPRVRRGTGQGQLLRPMATNQMARADLAEERSLSPAHLRRERTPRVEVTAGRWIGGIGDFPRERYVTARSMRIRGGRPPPQSGGGRGSGRAVERPPGGPLPHIPPP